MNSLGRRFLAAILTLILIAATVGCGSDRNDTVLQSDTMPSSGAEATSPTGTETTSEDSTTNSSKQLTSSSASPVEGKTMDNAMRNAFGEFALKLFAACDGENGSLVSPFSVYTALCMLENGAAAATAEELNALLGLDEASRNAYMAEWLKKLTVQQSVKFTIADSLWINDYNRDSIKEDFLAACVDYFTAAVYSAPMNAETVADINAWTKEKTLGMIKELLSAGDLDEGILMVLINAIAMDAEWQQKFEQEKIKKDATFTHEGGSTSSVTMLNSTESGGFMENDSFIGCMKSYVGDEFRFVALLPKEGIALSDAIRSLTWDGLRDLLDSADTQGDVRFAIPKFRFEYSNDLVDELRSIGMNHSFADADLSRMSSIPSSVDKVIHKTYLELDDAGTKAAAATAIIVRKLGASPYTLRSVICDRPFLYMIIDGNNLPLFIGTYR